MGTKMSSTGAGARAFYRAIFNIEMPAICLYRRARRLGLGLLTHIISDDKLRAMCNRLEAREPSDEHK